MPREQGTRQARHLNSFTFLDAVRANGHARISTASAEQRVQSRPAKTRRGSDFDYWRA